MFRDWMAHLCGHCLALRDEHGHAARLVTNYDGLLVSVLTEAQEPEASPRRKAGPCALRGFKGAEVVAARAEGARLAAAVSLLLAAGRTRDHIADGDGVFARRAPAMLAERVSARWDRAGGRTAEALRFDPSTLREAVARQTVLESTPGLPLLALLEPTETAVAAAFAHTAVLAGKPGNAAPLAEAGRFFGRLAHLLDAVEDLPEDHATGAFNPLLATGTPLREARRQADAARRGLRLALADTEFASRELVEALFLGETRRAVQRAFDGHPFAVFDDRPWTPDADPAEWAAALAARAAAPRKGHGHRHGHEHTDSCAHRTPKSPRASLTDQLDGTLQLLRVDGSTWTPAVAPVLHLDEITARPATATGPHLGSAHPDEAGALPVAAPGPRVGPALPGGGAALPEHRVDPALPGDGIGARPVGVPGPRVGPALPGDGAARTDGISARHAQGPPEGGPYGQQAPQGFGPAQGGAYAQQGVPAWQGDGQAGGYPPPPPNSPPPGGPYPPPGAPLPPGFHPKRGRRPGCGPELCLAGAAVGCTCGLWRPEWSEYHHADCTERCVCSRCDCGNCDCSGCGDCCSCCGGDGGDDGGCCDGCDCCDCGCDCNC
ncbi:hypothetical protein EDD29_1282 [Actinocorallia herbida]|uniref:Regulatory protein n=2 Tax=Actinocorallia herbida TaxID=58109 RepID=A0A3N1CR45_9ACTN|nr:hypothetical protein EDD29_1282 [Actinocorallia herbida]